LAAVNNDGELALDIAESDEMEEMLQEHINKAGKLSGYERKSSYEARELSQSALIEYSRASAFHQFLNFFAIVAQPFSSSSFTLEIKRGFYSC
jgi:hypothetical protein